MGISRLLGKFGLLQPALRTRETASGLLEAAVELGSRRRLATGPDGVPLPPRHLIQLVAGTRDPAWFLESGQLATQSIAGTLARHERNLDEFTAVLDFGCGCGRVIRHMRALTPAHLYGSDYNPKLVSWCRKHLPFARFAVNGLAPPLDYEDGTFDLVYALSVFTHMPEELQLAWAREIRRILRRDGYLLLTTHGLHYLPMLSPAEQEAFGAGRLVVHNEPVAGTNFCAAYHPERYIRERLAAGFTVVELIPEGAAGNPFQDIVLLRKS